MLKIVAVLALTAISIVTGHLADQRAATADTVPPLMYAGIRG